MKIYRPTRKQMFSLKPRKTGSSIKVIAQSAKSAKSRPTPHLARVKPIRFSI